MHDVDKGGAQPLLAPEVEKELGRIRGRWVATTTTEILATGATFEDVKQYSAKAEVQVIWVDASNTTSLL